MRLFDTSFVIRMIRNKKFEVGAISILTIIEILRGVSPKKRNTVKSRLENAFDTIGIDNKVILEYCSLYQALKSKGELIPDADLIIAASAKAYDLELVTMDNDFERLRKYGIKVTLISE
ncbi:MAG: type II toxin-antitoxin system VapC family toxin [Candidatus Njordarchaeota archaeon]